MSPPRPFCCVVVNDISGSVGKLEEIKS